MTTDAMQLSYRNRISAVEKPGPHLLQTRYVLRLDADPFPDLTGECFWDKGRRTRPYALVFLLCMAAISLVREVGDGLIGSVLLEWFGVALDPFILSVVLHLAATLVGIGVAGCFSKEIADLAARRHMLLALLAAMGIGLILVWLSRFAGYSHARDWPLVVVYLLWAWVAAISNAQVR